MIFFILLVSSTIALLFWVHNLLLSSLLAFVFFFLMNPFVEKLEKKGLSRLLGTTLIFTLVTALSIFFLLLFAPTMIEQFKKLQSDWPQYSQQGLIIQKKLLGLLDRFTSTETMELILEKVRDVFSTLAQGFFKTLADFLSSSLTVLFLAPFLTFFMLLDGPTYMKKTIELAAERHRDILRKIFLQLDIQIGGFIRARIIETLVISLIIYLGLLLMSFPYALILGCFAGLLNIIPYIGPLIGALPAFLIAAGLNSDPTIYWQLFALYGASQVIDSIILVPFLVARIVNLHPVVVVLSVIVGAQALGILGMIISIPVCGALNVILRALHEEFYHKKHSD